MRKPTYVLTSVAAAILCVSGSAAAQARLSAYDRNLQATKTQAATRPVTPFPEDARIAYVDIDRVAALSGEGKAAAAKLDELRNKKAAEVSARGKEVEALQTKLTTTASILNETTRRQLERQFQRAQIDFQRFSEDAQAEVQEAQRETLRGFNAQLFPVIDQIAKEKKLWAVFGNDNAMWWNTAIDLTEEVARRLDKR